MTQTNNSNVFISIFRQWLPKNKITLLGKDKKFDHLKLNEAKTTAQRESVKRAFNCARQPHCPE
jgi:hypothetical protein